MVVNVGELVMFENPKGPLEFCQSMTESHSVYYIFAVARDCKLLLKGTVILLCYCASSVL